MLRLFLGIIAFLTTSFGGLWYSASTDSPLDEASFENESIRLPEEASVMAPTTGSSNSDVTVPLITTAGVRSSEEKTAAAPSAPVLPVETAVAPQTEPSGLAIAPRILRFGFRTPDSPRTIDTIVLHSSYNALGGDPYPIEKTISEYEQYGVGAHYLIDRSGAILRLVEEGNIAYHAGASKMTDGRKNVNDFSIGIEMIATEDSGYTDKQYAAVNALIADIRTRHKIKSVVGHMDIAPSRKTDPWKFDWKRLK